MKKHPVKVATGYLVLAVIIWSLVTSPVWHELITSFVANLPMLIAGVIIVPAGTALVLFVLLSVPGRGR